MQLPFFYEPQINNNATQVVLNEETSKHCVQVLRMKNGDNLQLTNGLGYLATAKIIEANKKNTIVNVLSKNVYRNENVKITIAISLLKNASRLEWFLEKATEIGMSEIIPLICHRTEKQSFKYDRLNNILISAMLQSRQTFLPILHQPINYQQLFVQHSINHSTKLIAHCLEQEKVLLKNINTTNNTIILIGPEGDFTPQEIELALQHQYQPVTLGNTRLRTETAGIVAATLLANSGK